MIHTVEIDLHGLKITMETGLMAKQAAGSVVIRCGDNVVLSTACSNLKAKENQSFFPLTCDYREYTYAAGKFPGGYIKREGRMSEKETLNARLMDRPIRPLFPEGYLNDTQVVGYVISADPERDPGVLALSGAGAALAISDIPFHHFIAGVRVAVLDGKLIAMPTYDQAKKAEISIVVAGTETGVVMVEAGGLGASEEEVVRCVEFGLDCCKTIIAGIKELVAKAGKPKREFKSPEIDKSIYDTIAAAITVELTDAMDTKKYSKLESYAKVDECKAKAKALFEGTTDEDKAKQALAGKYFDTLKESIFREEMLTKRRRPDGRAFDEIRNLEMSVGLLPRTHGSCLFTRGETQALVTTTLGTSDDEQKIEMLDFAETSKRWMLHYNFPPFSVGEVGFMRGAGRREIGHGNLAERAIAAVLPSPEEFGYTIRCVSDILESNGSSSMASVCGGILSLMDAGVPIKEPVAGIAMGLVKEGDKYAILTDIAGAEDHYGDMDFKVTGSRTAVTALQMDLKVANVSADLLTEALEQARKARLFLLDAMDKCLSAPRKEMSQHAPRMYMVTISTDKIRELIGPGGKVIRGIVEQTGAKIDVEDDGSVKVFASDNIAAQKALTMINNICAVAEPGKTYLGTVTRIADFGAFVEIIPGTDGLLHISEISENRVRQVRDELNEGDQIMVKVLAVEGNKIKLSRKALLKEQRDKLKGAI
ncbi:polyribonucleotide nucleotidyltransferase [Bryobacter aggregatus]|uniref:polyribonucleotide nucleotidyltransferase n=1 Tax=Bryobacter aggregatus TaxID=360054 RepID=UPI0004E260E3|nr:polyribonucleotide nucleotidyltransferase [Bryobacter aggregatus]